MAVDLVAFQEELISRLRAVADVAAVIPKLGFRVGHESWLVDVKALREVLPLPTILSVPLTQRWFSGVANIRGNLYSVVDFASLLGGEPTPSGGGARLLLLNGDMRCALAVGRIVGLFNPEQLELRHERPTPLVKAEYLDDQGTLWKELDVIALEQSADFMKVAA